MDRDAVYCFRKLRRTIYQAFFLLLLLGRARLFIVGEERGCLQNIEESALSVEDSAGKVMCIRSWTLGRIVEIRNWRLPRNVSRIASNHLLILILDP